MFHSSKRNCLQGKCQNDVTLLLRYGSNCLYICGTNALSPYCQIRNKRNLFEECEGGINAIGLSTFDRNCPAYHLAYRNYIFTALAVDISCQKQTLLRALPQHRKLWLPVNDHRWFHVIKVYRQGRVGGVCADDPEVTDGIVPYKNTFNSFGKLSLTCPLDTSNLHLRILKTAQISSNFIFIIFWNGFERFPISALCIFDLNVIEKKLFAEDEVPKAIWKVKESYCPKRNQSGFPRILDKTGTIVNPHAQYIFPEMVEIVSVNAASTDDGNYQIIAISKMAKVYGLIFNGSLINEKWTDQITVSGKILEMKIRKNSFTVLASNSFKEYKVKDWSSEITGNISQNTERHCKCEWTEWSSCSQRCAGGYRRREWRCLLGNICDNLFNENQQQYQPCNNVSCNEVRRYSPWSAWLPSGRNTEIRYRASCGVEIPDPMSIKNTLYGSKRVVTHEWLAWNGWTACSATCGNSLRSRWRTRKGLILAYDDSIQYVVEPCSIPSCEFDDTVEWTNGSGVQWRILKCSTSDDCIYKLGISDFSRGINLFLHDIIAVNSFISVPARYHCEEIAENVSN
uniref:Sema domain-containing protein n=1 Tax=Elaeophora elaphi TaxID=1147741 RepID=A0A0R3RLA1_9BILA